MNTPIRAQEAHHTVKYPYIKDRWYNINWKTQNMKNIYKIQAFRNGTVT